MKKITKNEILWLFDYHKNKGVLIWKNHPHHATATRITGKIAGSFDALGYRCVEINYTAYKCHQLIWFLEKGYWVKLLDHTDGNVKNNHISNLRAATSRQNSQNRIVHRNGKLVGATLDSRDGRWDSRIRIDGKIKHLGRFETEREAHQRYVQELRTM